MHHTRAPLSLLLALSLPALSLPALSLPGLDLLGAALLGTAALSTAALGLASTAAVAAPAASSRAMVLAEPLVDLLPVDEIIGDGQTAATLYLVAVGTDGKPITGLTGRLIPTQGDVGRIQELAPGRYRVDWTPPAVDESADVEMTLRVRPPGGANIVKKVSVQVVPALSHSVAVTSTPRAVVLGQDPSATLSINLSGGAESTLSGADLAVQASSGTVANVTPLGRGQYSLLFTAPAKKFPHLALITVSDRRDSGSTLGALALPMSGRAPFPVVGQPDSSIVVRVAGLEFGPVQSNAQGKATITLTVPPGTTQATVISSKDGQTHEEPLDLKVPPTSRVQLFPMAPALAADGRSVSTVRVFIAEPDGRPDANAKVSLHASTGSIGPVRHEGDGIYAADWTPAVSTQATTATITVDVEDATGPQQDSLDVRLLPARPEVLVLESAPLQLPTQGGHFKLRARISGPTTGHGVSLSATGAQEESAPTDRGQGLIEADFNAPGDGTVTVQAAVIADTSANPLARVLIFPATERIAADGSSKLPLTVITVDAMGYPVANTPVALAITHGPASVPPTVTTDAHGIAHTALTAGDSAALIAIQAATGGHVGTAVVLQLPVTAQDIDLPVGGDALAVSLRQRWEPLIKGMVVTRASADSTVAAAARSSSSRSLAAGIATLLATAPDGALAPGQTITLTVRAEDASGAPAAGRSLQVFSNAGTTSTAKDMGDGSYQVDLTAPTQDVDLIRVTVVSPDSGLSTMIEVPVGQPEPAWGIAAAEPSDTAPQESQVRQTPVLPTTQPVAQREVEAPATELPQDRPTDASGHTSGNTSGDDHDHPWLRAQAGFLGGFYSYRQVPFTSRGPLYGDRIAFGGGETPAAGSAGASLALSAWLPVLDFLGARATFRTTRYAVELANFNAVIPDWVNDTQALALVRYPVDLKQTRLSPALRVGVGLNDFMIYRQDTSAATPVMNYGPLVVPSFNVGAELGVDVAGKLYVNAGATFGLNGGGGLYSKDIGGTVAYTVADPLYLYGTFGWMSRTTNVYVAGDSGSRQQAGQLDDTLTSFGGGLGVQF